MLSIGTQLPVGAAVQVTLLESGCRVIRVVPAERMVHVLNAPSPAATASLAIGSYIARRVMASLSQAQG